MKLNELTRNYPFDPNTIGVAKEFFKYKPKGLAGRYRENQLNTLDENLKRLGWKKANYGSYSNVYEKADKTYILKINTVMDKGFAWFAFLTRKFPNIHFPKIGDAKVIMVEKYKYYLYMVEKLKELPQVRAGVLEAICSIAENNYYDGKDVSLNELLKEVHKFYEVDVREAGIDEEFLRALDIIFEYHGNNILDLHDANFMQRTDGTPIIIDPYVYWSLK